ncbi:MAG: response regulator [Phycisphaerales bacterium]|nr:response regulator [Phycisphaerales bacterium]
MIASSNEIVEATRTLIVEDSYLLGLQMKMDLESLGMVIHGPVPNVQRAMDVIEKEEVDAAILDINLGNETSFPIALALMKRNIPFIFITGYDDLILDNNDFRDHELLRKPIRVETLYNAVRKFN